MEQSGESRNGGAGPRGPASRRKGEIFARLGRIDRRWLYLVIAVAVGGVLLRPLDLPIPITEEVRKVYDAIEELPAGTPVLVSFDFGAPSMPELQPMATAVVRHCFRRGLRVVGLGLLPEGTSIGAQVLDSVAEEMDKVYGIDYVHLGYKPQIEAAILGMGEDIARVFPRDFRSLPTADHPVMQGIKNYRDVPLVVAFASGTEMVLWIQYAGARYGQRIVAGAAAVMATVFYPYLDSGQIEGLIPGLRGASEYEQLIGTVGRASRGMDAQSVAHLLIICFIVLGNVGYLASRHTRGER
jgi:hypothetical protein